MPRKTIIKITLLLASMMTMMAGAVVAPALPQIKEEFGNVESVALLTRLIITLPAIFIAFLSPVYGYIIDMFGRKRFLVFALILYCFSGTSGYYLNNLYLILMGRAFLGVSVAGIMTIATTLTGDYFSGNELRGFIGILGAFISLGGVFFITVSGWLADINWQMPFLIYAFSLPVLILVIIFLYEPEIQKGKSKSGNNPPKQDYAKKLIFFIYVTIFMGMVFFYMTPIQIPFLLTKLNNVSNSMFGYALSISTFSSAMVSINYRSIKRRLSYSIVYVIAFTLMALGYTAVSFSREYYQYLLSLTISGMGLGLLMPSGNLWIMELSPASLRGRLVGRGSAAMFLGMFFSPILVQPIVSVYNTSIAFRIAGLILVSMAILFFFLRKHLNNY